MHDLLQSLAVPRRGGQASSHQRGLILRPAGMLLRLWLPEAAALILTPTTRPAVAAAGMAGPGGANALGAGGMGAGMGALA